MWKSNERMEVENVDNYLASIERAKEELNRLNADIKLVSERRDMILSENEVLLKEKLELIDQKRIEVEGILQKGRESHADNVAKAEELKKQSEKLFKDQEILTTAQDSHAQLVKTKENNLSSRESEIQKASEHINTVASELSLKIKENNDLLVMIMKEQKVNEDLYAKVCIEKGEAQTFLYDAKKEKEEDLLIKSQNEQLKEDAHVKLEEAQKAFEDSRINKSNADRALASVASEKASLNDLIIESKRASFEAVKSTQAAQRNIAEANQKIAELKELKDAMAKQEN